MWVVQDALAAAKAKFEQQQKENERIAEMNKRQRLGLPMERKPTQEVHPLCLKPASLFLAPWQLLHLLELQLHGSCCMCFSSSCMATIAYLSSSCIATVASV